MRPAPFWESWRTKLTGKDCRNTSLFSICTASRPRMECAPSCFPDLWPVVAEGGSNLGKRWQQQQKTWKKQGKFQMPGTAACIPSAASLRHCHVSGHEAVHAMACVSASQRPHLLMNLFGRSARGDGLHQSSGRVGAELLAEPAAARAAGSACHGRGPADSPRGAQDRARQAEGRGAVAEPQQTQTVRRVVLDGLKLCSAIPLHRCTTG